MSTEADTWFLPVVIVSEDVDVEDDDDDDYAGGAGGVTGHAPPPDQGAVRAPLLEITRSPHETN